MANHSRTFRTCLLCKTKDETSAYRIELRLVACVECALDAQRQDDSPEAPAGADMVKMSPAALRAMAVA